MIAFEVLRDVAAQFGWSTMDKDFVGARATAHEVAHLFFPEHNADQNSLMFAPADEQTQAQSPSFGTVFLDDEIDKIRNFGLGDAP